MRGVSISPTAIGGAGPKSHLFSSSLSESVGFHKTLGGFKMGQTAENFYFRARQALASFDSLVNRLRRVAYKEGRDMAFRDFGLTNPTNKDLGKYMRDAVAYDLSQADSYTPVAYEQGFPSTGPSRRRVGDLEEVNNDLEDVVKEYERVYGVLPEPVVIDREVPGAIQTVSVTPPWVLPAAVAAGGVLVLATLFGAFK